MNLTTDHLEVEESFRLTEEERKARGLFYVGCTCLVVLSLFAIGNLLVGNYVAVIIKVCALTPLAIGTYEARTESPARWAVMLIASSLLTLLTVMLWLNEHKVASALWFLAAPLLLYSGLGVRLGFIVSTILLAVLTLSFYALAEFYSTSFLLRFYCVYSVACLTSYIYESTNVSSRRKIESLLKRNSDLESLLPICAWCKQIRDNEGSWHMMESYMSKHSNIVFTHGICNVCVEKQEI